MKLYPNYSNKTILAIKAGDIVSYKWEPGICLSSNQTVRKNKIVCSVVWFVQNDQKIHKTDYIITKPWWWSLKVIYENLSRLFR